MITVGTSGDAERGQAAAPSFEMEAPSVNREAELSRVFVELADTLVADFDVVDFLHTLTLRCVDLFDVDAAGLMLADPLGVLRVVAASSERVELLELFELQNEEGPCLECYNAGSAVMADNLDEVQAWPRFSEEARGSGFRAVQAVPLRLRGQVIGALNLFRAQPGRLDDQQLSVCQAVADVATIGLLQERAVREARLLAEQLNVALNSRVVIEQAKGILSERRNVDMDAAFRLLREYARHHNFRLAEVARDVIEGRLVSDDLDGSDR
jgi:GAF domain-containing protein